MRATILEDKIIYIKMCIHKKLVNFYGTLYWKRKWSAVHLIIYNVNQKIVEQLLEINHDKNSNYWPPNSIWVMRFFTYENFRS